MANVFRGYVKEFKECLDEARKRLSEGHAGDVNAKKVALADANRLWKDGDQIVKQMQLAARSGDSSGALQREVDGFKAELVNLKREIQMLQDKSDRSALLGGSDEEAIGSIEERSMLRGDRSRLMGVTNNIVGAQTTANEALDVGRSTLGDLARQRERLEQSRFSLQNIKSLIQDSGRIIKSIWNGNHAETAIKLGICLILVILIFVISYLRWIRRVIQHSPEPAGSPFAPSSNVTQAIPDSSPYDLSR